GGETAGGGGAGRRQGDRALRDRRRRRARVSDPEGIRARADRCLLGAERRRLPRLPRPAPCRAGPGRGRPDHRGHVRATRAGGGRADRPRRAGREARHPSSPRARGARDSPVMPPPRGIGQIAWLVRRHLAPHWSAVALLLASGLLATLLGALLPVLMAPILDLALGQPATASAGRIGLGSLSLQNLGAAFFQWLGISAVARPFAVILVLCGLYVAVGLLKACIDFTNFLLAQWIRIRATTGIPPRLFKHLMGLSMAFFNRQRLGELVSRVESDTRSATSGLEMVVSSAVTAPLLILFYSYLLVRTSPLLVVAAVGAAVLHWGVTRSIRRLASAQFSVFAELASRFQETILSIRIIKSFGAEAFEQARLHAMLERVRSVHFRFGLYKHADEPARSAVNYVVEASVLAL